MQTEGHDDAYDDRGVDDAGPRCGDGGGPGLRPRDRCGEGTIETPVNLNTATAAQLEMLPGVGPATSQRIMEYRQKNGAFKKVEDVHEARASMGFLAYDLSPCGSTWPRVRAHRAK